MTEFLRSATAPDWASAAIALMALGLSSYSLYLQWRDKRPHLEVRVTTERRFRQLSYNPTTDRSNGEHQIVFVAAVANTGDRPIKLKDGFVRPLFGRGTGVKLEIDYRFNELLPDSSREVLAFPREAIMEANYLARLVGLYRLEVRDHMGRRWPSGFARIGAAAAASWPSEERRTA